MPASPYTRFGTSSLLSPTQTARRHTVAAGETVPLIAAAEYRTGYDSELWRQIAEYNEINDLDELDINQVLAIPPPTPVE